MEIGDRSFIPSMDNKSSDEWPMIVIEAMAAEEARYLYETEFSHENPYTRFINDDSVPISQRELFCRLVEEELAMKGEKIHRDGNMFKICRYQA